MIYPKLRYWLLVSLIMKFIKGDNRTQINLFPVSLEHAIDEDNEVRIIDLFVDSVSLEDYRFKIK